MLNATPTVLQPAGPPRRRSWWYWLAAAAILVFAMCSGLCARACNEDDEKPAESPSPDKGRDALEKAVEKGVKELIKETDDDAIEEAVEERLAASKVTSGEDLSVSVDDGVVTLEGEVESAATSQVAAALAETVAGVTEVRNRIRAPQQTPGRRGSRPDVVPPARARPAPPVPPVGPAPRTPPTGPVDPDSIEGRELKGHLTRGHEAMRADRPEVAIRHYGVALSIDPSSKEASEGLEKAAAAMATSWTRRVPLLIPPTPTPRPTPEP